MKSEDLHLEKEDIGRGFQSEWDENPTAFKVKLAYILGKGNMCSL